MAYFVTNTLISLILIAAAKLLRHTPAGVGLALLFLALASWFIPWQIINIPSNYLMPIKSEIGSMTSVLITDNIDFLPNYNRELDQSDANISIQENQSSWSLYDFLSTLPFLGIFSALSVIGLLLFLSDIYRYQKLIKSLNTKSRPNDALLKNAKLDSTLFGGRTVEVKVAQTIFPGMATGLLKPIIWIDEKYAQSKHAGTILLHELTHIRNFDPLLKWITVFSRRLFWWNIIVRHITKHIEFLIELKCDQSCFNKKRDNYSIALAELIWQQNGKNQKQLEENLVGIASIYHPSSINIARLKSLDVPRQLNLKHLMAVIFALFLVALMSTYINTRQAPTIIPDFYEMAVKFRNRRASKKPMPIFLPNTKLNEAYNRQTAELVALSKTALSQSPEEIDQLFRDITQWDRKRGTLGYIKNVDGSLVINDSLEKRMSMNVLSIQHFLLQQQGKNREIIALFKSKFPSISQLPKFYRHHLAIAYLRLGQPEKAITVLQLFDYNSKDLKLGSVTLMASALTDNSRYDQALAIIEQQIQLRPNNFVLQNLKYGVLLAAGDKAAAEQLSIQMQKQGRKAKNPLSSSLQVAWSPILDHI